MKTKKKSSIWAEIGSAGAIAMEVNVEEKHTKRRKLEEREELVESRVTGVAEAGVQPRCSL